MEDFNSTGARSELSEPPTRVAGWRWQDGRKSENVDAAIVTREQHGICSLFTSASRLTGHVAWERGNAGVS